MNDAASPAIALDGKALSDALRSGIHRLITREEVINKINVFPVPDGDTGTNLALTLQAVLTALRGDPETHAGQLLTRVGRRGARRCARQLGRDPRAVPARRRRPRGPVGRADDGRLWRGDCGRRGLRPRVARRTAGGDHPHRAHRFRRRIRSGGGIGGARFPPGIPRRARHRARIAGSHPRPARDAPARERGGCRGARLRRARRRHVGLPRNRDRARRRRRRSSSSPTTTARPARRSTSSTATARNARSRATPSTGASSAKRRPRSDRASSLPGRG